MIFLVLVWLLIPILVPFLISRLLTPIYWPKYTIVASLAFYILVSKGITNIRHNRLKFIVIISIVTFTSLGIHGYHTTINKQQWREVANYIDTNADPGDLLIINAGYMDHIFNYYSKRTDLILKPFPDNKSRYVDEVNINQLEIDVEEYMRVWLMLSHSTDEKGIIAKKLTEAYNLSYQREFLGIRIALYERK